MSGETVGPLKRVTLTCRAGMTTRAAGPGSDRLPPFVFGIGREGPTPFERLLSGRMPASEIRFTIAAGEADAFFGHLAPAFAPFMDPGGQAAFVVRIEAVERPDPREVVRALAQTTGHGPCDCGCSGPFRQE